jgi:hypothetical protein
MFVRLLCLFVVVLVASIWGFVFVFVFLWVFVVQIFLDSKGKVEPSV